MFTAAAGQRSVAASPLRKVGPADLQLFENKNHVVSCASFLRFHLTTILLLTASITDEQ